MKKSNAKVIKMSALDTLNILEKLASVAEQSISKDNKNIELGNDITGSLRTYNKVECTAALGIDNRTLSSLCKKLNIKFNSNKLNIVDINLLRDYIYPETRNSHVLSKAAIYVVSNLKGGVSKTTTTGTLAAGLATEIMEYKYRVLVIDLDPQASLTNMFLPQFSEDQFTIGDLLTNNFKLDENETYDDFIFDCCIPSSIPNLSVMPIKPKDRSYEIKSFYRQMDAESKGEQFIAYTDLKKVTDSLSDKFDIIIIDTPPNFGILNLSAHFVAKNLIIPIKPSQIDRDSTYKYLSFLSESYQVLINLGHDGYDNINILPVDVSETSVSETRLATKIRSISKMNCFTTNFIHSEAIKVAAEYNNTIYNYSPSSYPSTRNTLARIQQSTDMLITVLSEQLLDMSKTTEV